MTKKELELEKEFGRELLSREALSYSLSYRENGAILRDNGDGFRIWKRLKEGVNVAEYIEKRKATYANPPQDYYFTEQLRKIVVQYCLTKRVLIFTLLDLLGEDIDGMWSELDENGHRIELEDLQEIKEAYDAAVREKKERDMIKNK